MNNDCCTCVFLPRCRPLCEYGPVALNETFLFSWFTRFPWLRLLYLARTFCSYKITVLLPQVRRRDDPHCTISQRNRRTATADDPLKAFGVSCGQA